MNRRDLFKLLGATTALTAAGLVIPGATKYFLPPVGGWGAQRLKVRKIQQYLINTDTMPWRYDATWVTRDGQHVQYHVDTGSEHPCDEMAIHMLTDRMEHDGGTPNSDQFILKLPRGLYHGSYFYVDTLHRVRV
jgi:hypothetical protein